LDSKIIKLNLSMLEKELEKDPAGFFHYLHNMPKNIKNSLKEEDFNYIEQLMLSVAKVCTPGEVVDLADEISKNYLILDVAPEQGISNLTIVCYYILMGYCLDYVKTIKFSTDDEFLLENKERFYKDYKIKIVKSGFSFFSN